MMLNEKMKNHGNGGNYEMVMNLDQVMLVGGILYVFLNERRAQESKKKSRKENQQQELTQQQIHDCAFFELTIHAFDIQSGWKDTFNRQRKYTRRDLFMGEINPDKCSQRLQDMNKYLLLFQLKKIQESKK
jgi:hypothetical protein